MLHLQVAYTIAIDLNTEYFYKQGGIQSLQPFFSLHKSHTYSRKETILIEWKLVSVKYGFY